MASCRTVVSSSYITVDPVRWGQALDQLALAQPFKDRGRAADSFTDAYLPAMDERLF